MKRRLFLITAGLALALGVVTAQQNDQPRGDLYSSTAIQALEQCFDSTGAFICAPAGGGTAIGGSGTVNTVPKWTAITTLGDSDLANVGPPPAGASGDVMKFTFTLNPMDGNDTVRGLFLDPTNADHTGVTNIFSTLEIGAITGDAQATENGITVGAGYDNPLNLSDPSYSFLRSIFMADGGIIEADGSGGGGSLAFQLGTTDNDSVFIFYNSNQSEMLILNNVEPAGIQITPLLELRSPSRVALADGARFVGFNWGISGILNHAGNNEIIGLRMSGSTDTVAAGTFERIFLESTGPWDTLVRWEGLLIDANETLINLDEPTADRTITFPDADGTVGFEIAVNQDFFAQAAQLGNPGTNEIRLYVDESTDRTGGASDDCVIVARLASGIEIDVSILVTDGGC